MQKEKRVTLQCTLSLNVLNILMCVLCMCAFVHYIMLYH